MQYCTHYIQHTIHQTYVTYSTHSTHYTVCIKLFEGENFHGFCGFLLIANVLPLKIFLEYRCCPLTYKAWYHLVLSSQPQKFSPNTVWRKILTGESIDEFDEFLSIRQHFPYQNFTLIIFSRLHARLLFRAEHYR